MKEANKDDLVFSLLFDGRGGAVNYGWKEIQSWTPEKGTLWIHLSLPQKPKDRRIDRKVGISQNISEALLSSGNRPRVLKEEDKLFLTLRAVNFNPGDDPDDMVFLHIHMEKKRIITIRHRKVLAIDNIRSSFEERKGPKDSYEFLLEVLSKISNRIGEVVQNIDDQICEIEELVVEKADIKFRSDLSSLRRQAINIRRYLTPQREVLNYLAGLELSWFKRRETYRLRELTEKYIRYLEDIDSAREKAALTHEEIKSIYSEQLNKTMYLLSIVATIFLPLSFLTGLLGINVGGIPGTDKAFAFLVVCILLVILGIIELLVFKIKKWI